MSVSQYRSQKYFMYAESASIVIINCVQTFYLPAICYLTTFLHKFAPMKRILLLLAFLVPVCGISRAQNDFVEHSTDVVCFLPSAVSLAKVIADRDRKGFWQLGFSSATTIAVNYGLKLAVSKERPNGSGNDSFPSTHTGAAFDGATFLMRRYGWKWGVPAYALSAYVAWGRVHSDRHDWWDVLGGAAVGAASALVYTRPFMKDVDLTVSPVAYGDDGFALYLALRF